MFRDVLIDREKQDFLQEIPKQLRLDELVLITEACFYFRF